MGRYIFSFSPVLVCMYILQNSSCKSLPSLKCIWFWINANVAQRSPHLLSTLACFHQGLKTTGGGEREKLMSGNVEQKCKILIQILKYYLHCWCTITKLSLLPYVDSLHDFALAAAFAFPCCRQFSSFLCLLFTEQCMQRPTLDCDWVTEREPCTIAFLWRKQRC